jgi:hypothetical protein
VKKIPIQIRPTNKFDGDIGHLREEMGEAADQVFRDLATALKKLDKYDWDGPLPVKPFGSRGDTFAYEFSPGFVFTFRRETDRVEEKQPTLIRLFLKRVMRA